MGGSSKKVTVGHKYFLGAQLCFPLLDRMIRISVGGKEAWIGNRESGRINIKAGDLFGGTSREGGVSGALDLLPGDPEQGQNDYLISQLGNDIPAFRGVTSLVLRQMYIGMNPYLKNWEIRGQRIHSTTDGRPQWYPEKAEITIDSPFRETQFFYFVLDQSGSMGESVGGGLTRTDVMKLNMLKALDEIDRLRIDSKVSVSIGISAFSTSSVKTSRTNVDSADIAYLKGWVSDLVAGGGTNFNAGMQPAEAWFMSETVNTRITRYDPFTFEPIAWEHTPKPGRRICFFITDGEPNPESSAAEAVATASDLLDRSSGIYNDQDGSQVEMYGMNIDLQNTYWTKMLDNTPRDGVPVVSGGDPNALWDAIHFAAMGPSSAMNPAHIIRECITDNDWGMGHPPADLDAASFTAAADVLSAEGFGLSLLWDQQQPIEDFIQLVLSHIDGHLYVEPVTGLWVLKLIRDDYDAGALLTLNESNVSRIEHASWPAFGERVNSITVQYWDIASGTDDSISVQDIALAQMQGSEINTTVQYPGITTGALASRVASRDLRALSTPLLSCTLYAYREAEGLRLGDAFRLVWPDYGIGDVILRVIEIAYGDSHSHGVRIRAVQDVFALPAASLTAPAPIEWDPPDTTPAPVPAQAVLELPYYELVQRFGEREVSRALQDNPELGYLGVAAAAPSSMALNAQVATDAGAGFEETLALDFCPMAALAADIGYLDNIIPITAGSNLDLVEVGTHAQIDDELVVIDAVSATALTIRRGLLDTVPARHGKGATVLFWDAFVESNDTEYVLGDEVSAKVMPVTGSGQLPLEAAPTGTVVMDQRAARPYPPGNVKINGAYFPTSIAGGLALTWVGRNRLQQTGGALVDFLSGPITPEPGTTYNVIVHDENDALLTSSLQQSETAFDYLSAVEKAEFATAVQGRVGVYELAGESKEELDPYFDHVVALLPFEEQATADIAGNVWTNNNGVVITDAQTLFGQEVAFFDGAKSAFLSTPAFPGYHFDDADFCVEVWVYLVPFSPVGPSHYAGLVAQDGPLGRGLRFGAGDVLRLKEPAGAGIDLEVATPPTGRWVHVAGTRAGDVVRLFVDGDLKAQQTLTPGAKVSEAGSEVMIGRYQDVGAFDYRFHGYMSNLRITHGAARYTANFAVPTAPFPASRFSTKPAAGELPQRLSNPLRLALNSERDGLHSASIRHDVARYGYAYKYNDLYKGEP